MLNLAVAIDFVVHAALSPAADPTWWDLFFGRFQSVGPTVAALIVVGGAVLTLRQKSKTDARTLWWSRVEWAAGKAVEESAMAKAIGVAALTALAADKNNDQADRDLLTAIVDAQLDTLSEQRPEDDDVEFDLDEG